MEGEGGIERGDLEALCRFCFDSLLFASHCYCSRCDQNVDCDQIKSSSGFVFLHFWFPACVLRINCARFSKHHYCTFLLALHAWEPVSWIGCNSQNMLQQWKHAHLCAPCLWKRLCSLLGLIEGLLGLWMWSQIRPDRLMSFVPKLPKVDHSLVDTFINCRSSHIF